MKKFSCGAVIPKCEAKFEAESEAELMRQIAHHAEHDHGLTELSDDVVAKVREHIIEA